MRGTAAWQVSARRCGERSGRMVGGIANAGTLTLRTLSSRAMRTGRRRRVVRRSADRAAGCGGGSGGPGGSGGGIYNTGRLTLTDSTFRANAAGPGGPGGVGGSSVRNRPALAAVEAAGGLGGALYAGGMLTL